jgi:hypothetical protein
MLDVKANYKGKYRTQECRACKLVPETQTHILEECTSIHTSELTKVRKESYFEKDDMDKLKITAGKIGTLLSQLAEKG